MSKELTKSEKAIVGIGAGTTISGAGILALAHNRKKYQDNIDPNLLQVRGGTISSSGAPEAKTVFNFQRDNMIRGLEEAGVKVNVKANYKVPGYKPGTYDLKVSVEGKNPIADIHVGAHPTKSDVRLKLERLMNGSTTYRSLSDFGPGNTNSGKYYMGEKNWMRAPKDKTYTRNIVPGGDIMPTPQASKTSINTASIPVNPIFTTQTEKIVAPTNVKKQINLYGGSGYVWPKALPKQHQDIDTIIKSLDEVYGKDGYNLNILGGPFVNAYEDIFKESEKKHGGKIKYIPKTDHAGVKGFFTKADIAIISPGSTIAEIAAIDGYKPKIVGVGLKGGPHYKTNTEWFKKNLGGAEFYDLASERFEQEILTSTLKKLEESAAPSTKSIKISTEDFKKIVDSAKTDFKKAKEVTSKMNKGGKALLGAGALLSAAAATGLLDKYAEVKDKITKEDTKIVGGITAAALATRAAENKLHDVNSKVHDFVTFEEVLDYYKNSVKKGDVIFFKDSYARGKAHPVVVTSTEYFDWPGSDGWKAGERQTVVTDPSIKNPKSAYRGFGMITEVAPGDTVIRNGSLEGKLFQLTHITEPYIDEAGNKSYRQVFSRRHARELGSIHRAPDLDINKFDKVLKVVDKKREGGKFKYSIFNLKTNINSKCPSGTCVTFAHDLINKSRKKPIKENVFLPEHLGKILLLVKDSKTPHFGKTNFISPILGIEGARRMYHGYKTDDTKEFMLGAANVATGAAINVNKNVNNLVNTTGGIITETLGGGIIEVPAKVKDYLKGTPKKNLEVTRDFLKRNKGISKTVGATVLALPTIYGYKHFLDKIEKKLKEK